MKYRKKNAKTVKNPKKKKRKKHTIFTVIRSRKSWNSMTPLPSLSTSEIIFLISSFFGSKPRARMATFSSFASMYPAPSVSKRSKASLISCFCSSESSERDFFWFGSVFVGGLVRLAIFGDLNFF